MRSYQIAHNDLTLSISSGWSSGNCSSPAGPCVLGRLLDPSNWCSCSSTVHLSRNWSTTAASATSGLTASAEDLVERLIEFTGHFVCLSIFDWVG